MCKMCGHNPIMRHTAQCAGLCRGEVCWGDFYQTRHIFTAKGAAFLWEKGHIFMAKRLYFNSKKGRIFTAKGAFSQEKCRSLLRLIAVLYKTLHYDTDVKTRHTWWKKSGA